MYTKPGIYKLTSGYDCLRTEPNNRTNKNKLEIYVATNNVILILEKLHKFGRRYRNLFWFKGIIKGTLGYFVADKNSLEEIV